MDKPSNPPKQLQQQQQPQQQSQCAAASVVRHIPLQSCDSLGGASRHMHLETPPSVSKHSLVKQDNVSGRFTAYSDLGYESLHSTPKYIGSFATGAAEVSLQSASSCLLPDVDEDLNEKASIMMHRDAAHHDDDDDDDDDDDLRRMRDPIRRRISITTAENHVINAKKMKMKKFRAKKQRASSVSAEISASSIVARDISQHPKGRNEANDGGASGEAGNDDHVRQCEMHQYFFKWIPRSLNRNKRKKQTKQRDSAMASIAHRSNDLDNDNEDSELVEIKEEQMIVFNANRKVNDRNDEGDDNGKKDEIKKKNNIATDKTDASSTVPKREEWGKKMDFLLSIIGFAVDLSNVWRFPYLAYKNGGGVFLIPYTVMLLFGALPLFFMELSLGQFAKSGPINIWDKICPPMKGIGYCFVLISWYVSFYYNVIIAWTTNYVIKTLISGDQMPWQHCENEYNTKRCISMEQIRQLCGASREARQNGLYNETESECAKLSNRTSPTEEFFNLGLLQIDKADGFSNMGVIRPELIGCLIIVFVTLYFSLFKGVKSSGKVVWVTATAPYFILTILLARGLFLPGALNGIKYYMSPRLEMLADPNVWVDAAVQVFYSIGVGFGVHLTYASFNKFNNNCFHDCVITTAVNSLTSFYSGFVIFTYLGYMAYSMDKEIQNVASEGYGLVFQVYPEAISTLPFAKFWSILFFVMLLTLGIDSAMGGLEAVITGLMDEFKLHTWVKREVFTAIVICSSFLGALVNCTQGGAFTMVWFDTYSAGISLLCSAMFEALAVAYFYGVEQFCLDIESMIGHRPNRYFVISWKYTSPIFLSTIIIMSILNSEPLKYYGYDFPFWATFFGWTFTLSSISAVPTYAFIYYVRGGSCSRRDRCNVSAESNSILMLKNHHEMLDQQLENNHHHSKRQHPTPNQHQHHYIDDPKRIDTKSEISGSNNVVYV